MTIGLAALACLAVAGCGGEEGMVIDWDLSQRHTIAEVAWMQDDLDEYRYTKQLEPLESVRIVLPGGQVLRMDDRASDIILYRRSLGPEAFAPRAGEIVAAVEVYGESMTVEGAQRRALSYADQLGLPRAPIDAWRQRRGRGVEPSTDRTETAGSPRRPLGRRGGPVPSVTLIPSSGQQRPWVVMVGLRWPER